jgi:signal transduction histidine kinase
MLATSGVLALVIGAAFALLLSSVADLRGQDGRTQQSEQVLVASYRLERLIVDVENAQRGYLLTGRPGFLQTWQSAEGAFPGQAAALSQLVAGNPAQQVHVARIAAACSSFLTDYSEQRIEADRRDAATVTEDADLRVATIRAEVDGLLSDEQNLALERQRHAEAVSQRATLGAAAGLAGTILLVAGFAAYLTRVIVLPIRRIAATTGRLGAGDLGARLPESGVAEIGVLQRGFNTMAGALELGRDELAASRARIVAAADHARRRIERDLHDGIQQRLVSLILELRAARTPADLDAVAAGLDGALDELRELSRGIHPANLTEGGLRPALRALARRSAIPVELDVEVPARSADVVEVAAYYVVSEALTNAAKHANASLVRVQVHADERELHLTVSDDGEGGAEPTAAGGLIGLVDRVQALGGRLSITSPSGRGTTLEATLPRSS